MPYSSSSVSNTPPETGPLNPIATRACVTSGSGSDHRPSHLLKPLSPAAMNAAATTVLGTGLLPRVELEALQKLGKTVPVEPAPHASDEIYSLPAREARPQRHVAGDVSQAPVQLNRLAPGVAAKQPRLTGVLADQT